MCLLLYLKCVPNSVGSEHLMQAQTNFQDAQSWSCLNGWHSSGGMYLFVIWGELRGDGESNGPAAISIH